MLVYGKDLWIREQGRSPFICRGKVASYHERRTRNGPQRQKCALFVVCEPAISWLAPAGCRPQSTNWEHVGVRPVSWLCNRRPFGSILKLVADSFWISPVVVPNVPNIVRNSPHLRIFL